MSPTALRVRRAQPWLVVLIGTLLAAAMVFLSTPGAFAAAPDTPGGDQEATAESRYVPKSEVDYQLWNRLIGVDNPERTGEADER